MDWSEWKLWTAPIALAVAFIASIAGFSSTAHAQPTYPPPPGSVVICEIVDTTLAPGETTQVCSTVLGPDGDPFEGATVTFTIVSQPGTDATLSALTAVTDAQGRACVTLSSGTTLGEVTVVCESGGITSPVLGSVQAPEVVGPPVAPPPTGGGAGGGADSWQVWLIGISSALAAVAAGLLGLRVYSGRSRAG